MLFEGCFRAILELFDDYFLLIEVDLEIEERERVCGVIVHR